MSFINKLPLTTFTLPNGQEVEIRNILKTLIISEETKRDSTIIKRKNGVNVPKLENLSYQLYGDRKSLFWLTTHLNDIDSFTKMPLPASNFEVNLPNRFPGKVYYIYNARLASGILPGDYMVLYTSELDNPPADTWKIAGKIKEYDLKFRRIVVEKEVENISNSNPLPINPKLFVFRENEIPVIEPSTETDPYRIGRMENEFEKINSIYTTGLDGMELSPFRKLDVSGNLTDDYDFSENPSSDTILYKLSSNDLTDIAEYYYHTVEKEEIRNNTKNNNIKYLENDLAYEATSYINTLLASTFKRGQKITIRG